MIFLTHCFFCLNEIDNGRRNAAEKYKFSLTVSVPINILSCEEIINTVSELFVIVTILTHV